MEGFAISPAIDEIKQLGSVDAVTVIAFQMEMGDRSARVAIKESLEYI